MMITGTDSPFVGAWALVQDQSARCCCVIPTPAGAQMFRRTGLTGFRQAIADWLDRMTQPLDAIRVVDSLPSGALAMLERPSGPVWGETATTDHGVTASFQVPFDLELFEGHFSHIPIVPGAVLVGWTLDLAERSGLWPSSPLQISAVKFRRIVQPGIRYSVTLERSPAGDRAAFEIRSQDGMHASGTLVRQS